MSLWRGHAPFQPALLQCMHHYFTLLPCCTGMFTRSSAPLTAAVQRVMDAQCARQDAIAHWLLGHMPNPWCLLRKTRCGFDEWGFTKPETLLQHWKSLTTLCNPLGDAHCRSALMLLRLWYLPGDPASKLKQAPALLLRAAWDAHGKRSVDTIRALQAGLRTDAEAGRLLAQMCLLLTMAGAAGCALWVSEAQWALHWVQRAALDDVHALHLFAVSVMLQVHDAHSACIMECPALDVHALSLVPALTMDKISSAHGDLLRVFSKCACKPYTDAPVAVAPASRPGRGSVPWSRPAGAKVACMLLATLVPCWHWEPGFSCMCATCRVLEAVTPLLCALMARPAVLTLPGDLWGRMTRCVQVGRSFLDRHRSFVRDPFQLLTYSLVMADAVPAARVQDLIASGDVFPMTNSQAVFRPWDTRGGHCASEWMCLLRLLQTHPVLSPACVRLLQSRLDRAAAEDRLPADSVMGTDTCCTGCSG